MIIEKSDLRSSIPTHRMMAATTSFASPDSVLRRFLHVNDIEWCVWYGEYSGAQHGNGALSRCEIISAVKDGIFFGWNPPPKNALKDIYIHYTYIIDTYIHTYMYIYICIIRTNIHYTYIHTLYIHTYI